MWSSDYLRLPDDEELAGLTVKPGYWGLYKPSRSRTREPNLGLNSGITEATRLPVLLLSVATQPVRCGI